MNFLLIPVLEKFEEPSQHGVVNIVRIRDAK
jgi:hypothetical protein